MTTVPLGTIGNNVCNEFFERFKIWLTPHPSLFPILKVMSQIFWKLFPRLKFRQNARLKILDSKSLVEFFACMSCQQPVPIFIEYVVASLRSAFFFSNWGNDQILNIMSENDPNVSNLFLTHLNHSSQGPPALNSGGHI